MVAPELGLANCGVRSIRTSFNSIGYGRRTSKKKAFSNSHEHRQIRLEFSQWGQTWSRERLYSQAFSDEVSAHGGANGRNFVTVLTRGDKNDIMHDRYRPECLTRKHSKLPVWMFHGMILDGRKSLGTFWEREYGNMDSAKYDAYVLSRVEGLFREEETQGRYPWFQHDNAPCHRSRLTHENLESRRIRTISWPPYSPDLNLIEHVWAWMKSHINNCYFREGYDPQTISLDYLRQVVEEAWNAVPEEFIKSLYESWWDRCAAVISVGGGPTWY